MSTRQVASPLLRGWAARVWGYGRGGSGGGAAQEWCWGGVAEEEYCVGCTWGWRVVEIGVVLLRRCVGVVVGMVVGGGVGLYCYVIA